MSGDRIKVNVFEKATTAIAGCYPIDDKYK